MAWQNFKIWRGKLPHWRADDVQYFITFRHQRPLSPEECNTLFRQLLKPESRQWNLQILCVLPEATELLVTVNEKREGERFELSDIVEKAKKVAGRLIIKKSGERFPPFYAESFDRIMRDQGEFEETWKSIVESPGRSNLIDNCDQYPSLWFPDE